jgi:DTW domain-containing protein YfiP
VVEVWNIKSRTMNFFWWLPEGQTKRKLARGKGNPNPGTLCQPCLATTNDRCICKKAASVEAKLQLSKDLIQKS